MSTAFIILYDAPNKASSCSTFINNFLLEHKSDNNIIYHVFNQENYDVNYTDSLSHFFSDIPFNTFVSIDFNSSISDLVNDIQKYERYVILQPTLLIKKDLYKIFTIDRFSTITPQNNSKIFIPIYSRQEFISLVKNQIPIKLLTQEKYSQKNNNLVSNDIIDTYQENKIPIQETKNDQPSSNIFYDDSNCLFCLLGPKDNIPQSAIYLNKNNKKVYNINNNIFGNVIEYNKDILLIDWQINKDKYITQIYRKNNNMFV